MTTIAQINEKIDSIENAEKITKTVLSELSRDVFEYILKPDENGVECGDVQPVNRLLSVLTPVNHKASVIFFRHFLPFVGVTNEQGEFTKFGKKDKKHAEDKFASMREFLADPHNNIWTWVNRNVEVEPKPYNVAKVSKEIEKAIKKVGQKETIMAVFAGGVDMATLLEVLESMQEKEEPQE